MSQRKKWCCSLCKDSLKSPIVTKCGHIFCYSCVFNHLKTNKLCPICHKEINIESLTPVFGHSIESNNSEVAKLKKVSTSKEDDTNNNKKTEVNKKELVLII